MTSPISGVIITQRTLSSFQRSKLQKLNKALSFNVHNKAIQLSQVRIFVLLHTVQHYNSTQNNQHIPAMSASLAFIVCFLQVVALGAPTTLEHPTFMNSTGNTAPQPSTFVMLNSTLKDAGKGAGDNNGPPPKDNSNTIIGVVLGSTTAIVLILWCMHRYMQRRN
ncbi:hypothetical protein F5Y09DRAFT_345255 [Xylaria sp. FL1042]|nr:hypothetical protein F5Y09DRAFT_345255 [Xylaria sp. FL1042]